MIKPVSLSWNSLSQVPPISWVCGYCGNVVASDRGIHASQGISSSAHPTNYFGVIRICPQCTGPTFFQSGQQVPGAAYGSPVKSLPPEVEPLYNEARACVSASAPTAAVLSCRKLLMHVAVDKGADEGKNFEYYVNFLAEKNFIPAGAHSWVDQIRKRGNEANHEIKIKTDAEARELIDFSEMLLKVVYEYPARAVT